MLRHCGEKPLDKAEQSVRGVKVFVERLIERLAECLIGMHENRLIEPFFALEIVKDQALYYIRPRRNTLRARCGETMCGKLNLGRGQKPDEIHGGLAEGVFTAPVLLEMARERTVDMPISSAVAALLDGTLSVDAAIESLLTRPLKAEA